MKLLLHTCCGPCSIVPFQRLKKEGDQVRALFANPNIHPLTEWKRRLATLEEYCKREGVKLLPTPDYDVRGWLRQMSFREDERCRLCYRMRLAETAFLAKRGRFDGFTSTLLYSKFQKHELIKEAGEAVAAESGVPFYYQDWRDGWKEGVDQSRELEMYRQSYCGCIYSEEERYKEKAAKPKKGAK